MGKLGDRFTFANVVSVLSLLFALGLGTAWAATGLSKNEVRSSNIAKGQVKTPDLGKGAVTSAKVRNGTLLNRDFAKRQLPTSGIQRVVTFSASEDVDSQDVTATCPPGKKVVGGGGGWGIVPSDPANIVVLEWSVPTDALDGWRVKARRLPGGFGTWALRAEAVCMNVSS
jgi:hypothetical protein